MCIRDSDGPAAALLDGGLERRHVRRVHGRHRVLMLVEAAAPHHNNPAFCIAVFNIVVVELPAALIFLKIY